MKTMREWRPRRGRSRGRPTTTGGGETRPERVDLLCGANGDVDGEGAAEGEDGDPADGEAGEEQEHGERA